jgi:hypothetical protein
MARSLANPNVQVDNNTISIVPNTLKIKLGKGDKKLTPQSAGGSSISMVISEDATTKKSSVSFSLTPTKENIDKVVAWVDAAEGVTISIAEGSFSKQFRQMFIVSDPEFNLGADQNVEVKFEGLPSV